MDNQSNVDQEKVDTPPADTTATVQHSAQLVDCLKVTLHIGKTSSLYAL